MNLLCPNCQQMLNVPDEFAGQLMKCSLCNGTFTVPGLPGTNAPPSPPEPAVYALRPESPPPAPPASFSLEPPPLPSSAAITAAPPSPPPSLAPEGYHRTLSLRLNPKVLPWIAPVCLLLVFLLQFADWVGIYPGGVPAVTGNAWRAAFDFYGEDGDLPQEAMHQEGTKPGVSVLTIFYLLLFFPTLVLTIASVILPMLQLKLPPQVDKIMPWRWGIVAAVNLFVFLFLGLQVLLGFSLESHYATWVEKQMKRDSKENPNTKERKEADVQRGEYMQALRHTSWLRLTLLLHLIAIMSAALTFWLFQRGAHRPEPKLELMW
jgi:hypothetical protein